MSRWGALIGLIADIEAFEDACQVIDFFGSAAVCREDDSLSCRLTQATEEVRHGGQTIRLALAKVRIWRNRLFSAGRFPALPAPS